MKENILVPTMKMNATGLNAAYIQMEGYRLVEAHGFKPLFYSILLPYLRKREFKIFKEGRYKGSKKSLSGATKILYRREGINRRRPLEPKGELYDSLMGRGRYKVEYISRRKLVYGTKYPPAYFMQYGATIATTHKMITWFKARGINKTGKPIKIPARQFLYLDRKAMDDMSIMTKMFLERINKETFYYEPVRPFRWLAP